MERSKALYFPFISIPENKWTIKTLLYWDKLGSIVPMNHIEEPEKLTPFMRRLVERSLIEQISPSNYLHEIPDFESSFIEYLKPNIEKFRLPIKKRIISYSYIEQSKLKVRPPEDGQAELFSKSKVQFEKLGQLPSFLKSEGIAQEADENWFEMDTRVADRFMAYLAICLGAIPSVNAAPITNERRYANFLGHFRKSAPRSNHKNKASSVILNQLLPTPNEYIHLDDLLRFKEHHGHLLPQFRRKIEVEAAKIAIIETSSDRRDATEQFIKECKVQTEEIVDAMKPSWSKITFGSLVPIFGSGIALSTAGLNYSAVSAGSGLSFLASAYQAINSIKADREKAEVMPLAYLAHTRSLL
jgi:hypothetical protein